MSDSREEAADWTPPRTSIESIAWPPLPPPQAVRLMALGKQLDETQWWPAERLRDHQLRQLRELVTHAASTVPFYRERLRQSGIDTAQPFGWDAYARLPILSRRDLQEQGDRLRAETVPKSHGEALWIYTVGGIACPARVLRSGVSLAMSDAFALRGHGWRRERSEGKLAVIRALPPAAAAPEDVRHFPDRAGRSPRSMRPARARSWTSGFRLRSRPSGSGASGPRCCRARPRACWRSRNSAEAIGFACRRCARSARRARP